MLIMDKTAVVAGCGEIGKPIFQMCRGAYRQVIAEDPAAGKPESPMYPVDALHIAIPGSMPNFVKIVSDYFARYKPQIMLIHSSTAPGLSDEIVKAVGEDAVVHTQVHGKHHGNRMHRDMLRYPKFVATRSDAAYEKAKAALEAIGHPGDNIIRLSSPLAGELVKLLATSFFGYLIAWVQEVERLSEMSGISYEELMSFTKLQTDDFRIENKFPGVIGGHCVLPNIAILQKSFPLKVWDFIQDSNTRKANGSGENTRSKKG